MSTLVNRPNDLIELIENLKTENGVFSRVKIIYPRENACYCSGFAGKLKFHLTYMPDSFVMFGTTQVFMSIVEAISDEVGYRPFCRWRDNDSKFINFEWSANNVAQRKRDLLFVGKSELIFL